MDHFNKTKEEEYYKEDNRTARERVKPRYKGKAHRHTK
jgi:hypothetical protein